MFKNLSSIKSYLEIGSPAHGEKLSQEDLVSAGLCPSCTWRHSISLVNGVCPCCKTNWVKLQSAQPALAGDGATAADVINSADGPAPEA